jgi:hypothetical protein
MKIAGAPDARFREVMLSLAKHLHAFICEVGLTQEEWRTAMVAETKEHVRLDASPSAGISSVMIQVAAPQG